MLFELIATFAAGFCAAGAVLLLNHMSGGRLPKWLMPAMAGVAMIGYAIWSEYSWHDRAVTGLPEGITVAQSFEKAALWRPWTYVFPMQDRFIAVDEASLQMHAAAPDRRVVTLLFYARWSAPQPVYVAFDCAASKRALLAEGAALTPDGQIIGVDWDDVPMGDPSLTAVCTGLASTLADPA